jgi:hypothetical protein
VSQKTTITIRWISPTTPKNLAQCEEQIRREIAELDMDDPMDLIFHTVFTEGSLDGPCVSITPSDDRDCMKCWYDESPEWIEMGPLEEGPFAGKSVEYFDPKSKLKEGDE